MPELKDCINRIFESDIQKLIISKPADKSCEYKKITVIKMPKFYQIAKYTEKQVFHENISFDKICDRCTEIMESGYLQLNAWADDREFQLMVSKKGKVSCKEKRTAAATVPCQSVAHNRQKQYILPEGRVIEPLVDMGIFTKEGKVVNSMYDKFKQINRFIEIVDDAFREFGKDEVTILDFGCGKSYLTFIIYYYFTVIRKVKATVIGYDLKEDVVKHCNEIAEKYGYESLKFYINDVTKGELYNGKVDMVITLHACDIATDFALFHAIENKVRHIFSVPCCQHEVCSSIKKGGDFDLLLEHGLIKERFSALLTDSIRAEILKKCGYEVDIIEFVDFAHSPKNLMLRCKLKKPKAPDLTEIKVLTEKYGFTQKLYELMKSQN